MKKVLQPRRIKEGRLFRNLSQENLADELGVTKQAISQYENGVVTPKSEIIYKLADVLEFPLNYFSKGYSEKIITPIFFRKRKTSRKKYTIIFKTYINWMVDIYSYIEEYLKLPSLNLIRKTHVYYSDDEIREAAIELRRAWGLGNGPISNVTLLLENNGFIISKTNLTPEKVDACSLFFTSVTHEKRPMIFLTSSTSSVRSRRDIAHELGHQVLHSWMSVEDFEENEEIIEHEADSFANYFLMPADAMERECFAIDSINSLLLMKKRWGASAQSILYYLHNLGLISNDEFENLKNQIYRKGWRKKEPFDDEIAQEKPNLIHDAITMLIDNGLKTAKNILDDLSLPANDVVALCGISKSFFNDNLIQKPKLYLIKK
ncbi:helix-turn-helix domain-containing protein [Pectinatus frisingensis]|uniref:helix-turn-helix domain-containing protein n=1 Tax=Pectinatus frisingensis TaxID=865 RepID=UPI0015F59B5E|nr:XRE family transcriptional regulator [Pectinatus frisingensis]